MSNFKTEVTYKVSKEAKGNNKEMGNLYFKNVPVVYAQVLKPAKKYNSEDTAYQMGLFINADTMEELGEIGLNKEMAEVGKTKIKKGSNRGKLKYDPENEHYTPYTGMFGAQFSRDTKKKDGSERTPIKVVGVDGKPFTENVGNGSICNVKMFGYRNDEDMLVVMLDTVVVLEHVPYEDSGDQYDEVLGITVQAAVQNQEEDLDEELKGSAKEPTPEPKTGSTGSDVFDDDVPF